MPPSERAGIARAFGHDGPVRDGLFAWALDRRPDLRRAFQRLYGPPLPVEPPPAGDWKVFSDDQRRAVALLYGYDGPVRDGLFARYLGERPVLVDDFRQRYAPEMAPSPLPPAACPTDGGKAGAAKRAVAAFDADRTAAADDDSFARILDAQPDLRRAFQRLYGRSLPVEPPPAGDWKVFSDDQRRAVAVLYGYDGPIRDGLFARHLSERPALEADFRRRYLPEYTAFPVAAAPFRTPWRHVDWATLPADAQSHIACAFGYDGGRDGVMRPALFAWSLDRQPDLRRAFQRLYGPPPPVEPPPAGDWKVFSDDQRRAVALLYGYDGPVRDGLFARYLADRPALAEDHRRRYLPDVAPPSPVPAAVGAWAGLGPEQRRQAARAFGYDQPLQDGAEGFDPGFARALDGVADLRRAFQRLYGPPLPVEPPAVRDWKSLSSQQRQAVALLYGQEAAAQSDKLPQFLAGRPALAADFRLRYRKGDKNEERVASPLPATPPVPPPPAPTPAPVLAPLPAVKPVAVPRPAPAPSVTPALVAPSAPPSALPPAPPPKPAGAHTGIFLLAGSFKSPVNADIQARRLTGLGYKVEVGNWHDSKGGDWRVVRVGPFADAASAHTAAAGLKAAGVQAVVMK